MRKPDLSWYTKINWSIWMYNGWCKTSTWVAGMISKQIRHITTNICYQFTKRWKTDGFFYGPLSHHQWIDNHKEFNHHCSASLCIPTTLCITSQKMPWPWTKLTGVLLNQECVMKCWAKLVVALTKCCLRNDLQLLQCACRHSRSTQDVTPLALRLALTYTRHINYSSVFTQSSPPQLSPSSNMWTSLSKQTLDFCTNGLQSVEIGNMENLFERCCNNNLSLYTNKSLDFKQEKSWRPRACFQWWVGNGESSVVSW